MDTQFLILVGTIIGREAYQAFYGARREMLDNSVEGKAKLIALQMQVSELKSEIENARLDIKAIKDDPRRAYRTESPK